MVETYKVIENIPLINQIFDDKKKWQRKEP